MRVGNALMPRGNTGLRLQLDLRSSLSQAQDGVVSKQSPARRGPVIGRLTLARACTGELPAFWSSDRGVCGNAVYEPRRLAVGLGRLYNRSLVRLALQSKKGG